MQTIDLYSIYEGYQAIELTQETAANEIVFKVQLLAFHFEEVLSLIPPGIYDSESVVKNYFQSSGWHEGKWESKRTQEFYDQLISINDIVPIDYSSVYDAIKQICNSALQSGNRLFIELN